MAGFELCVKAHAKVNLYLDVIAKRPDGYHDIETVFHSIGLHDDVMLRRRNDLEITVRCDRPEVPCDGRNLAYRAAKLLLDNHTDLNGVDIEIHKRIPVAAGLAGGSANAAAVLAGMNQLFGLGYTPEALSRLGRQLGADVPFCLVGGAAVGCGIGDELTPLPPLVNAWLTLVNPGLQISTPWAFGQLNLSLTPPQKNVTILARCVQEGDLKQLAGRMHNGLESPVFLGYPTLAELKATLAKMSGSYGALMSGSGATVFAVMQDERSAIRAAASFGQLPFGVAATTSGVGLRFA